MKEHQVLVRVNKGADIDNIITKVVSDTKKVKINRLYDFNTVFETPGVYKGKTNGKAFDKFYATMTPQQKNLFRTYELTFHKEIDPDDVAKKLNKITTQIEFAETNEVNTCWAAGKEPTYEAAWATKNMQCDYAWNLSLGQNTVVAVVDSGIDYKHPEIKRNMWKAKDGSHGFDFVNNTRKPFDIDGHGTQIAGVIGAVGNNNMDMVGVAPKARIMALKGMEGGCGYASHLANCIVWAASHGAKVINCSWGPATARVIKDAVEFAWSQGAIVIFAAGNTSKKLNGKMTAASKYTLCVAAIDSKDRLAGFSNYGSMVNICAPGVRVLTLDLKKNFTYATGTSIACAHVTGLVALMFTIRPTTTLEEVKKMLEDNLNKVRTTTFKPVNGKVNAKKTITSMKKLPVFEGVMSN